MRKYGHNKENRPNPIVQMGLFMDYSGIPLAFVITDGSQNEQTTMVPLEKQIMKDFELSNFVVCTDAGLSSAPNRMFNNCGERSFVTTQSPKKLKKGMQDWALDPRGWKLPGEKGTFDISKIDSTDELRQKNYEKVFYKETFVEGYDDKRDVSKEMSHAKKSIWKIKTRIVRVKQKNGDIYVLERKTQLRSSPSDITGYSLKS